MFIFFFFFRCPVYKTAVSFETKLNGLDLFLFFQDAQKAIPKGTLLAILLTSIVYAGLAILIGSCVERFATGDVADLIAGNFTSACLEEGAKCEYGLLVDFGVSFGLTFHLTAESSAI